jgi:hypothetical protein
MPAVTEETWYHRCIEVFNDINVINDNNDNEDYRTVNLRQPLSENGLISLKILKPEKEKKLTRFCRKFVKIGSI